MNALSSLWSAPLAGNVGRPDRVQEVHTPTWILEAAGEALNWTIGLDPCAGTDPSTHFAEENWTLDPEVQELDRLYSLAPRPEKAAVRKARAKHYLGGALVRPWLAGSAFVNPPYEFLRPWLAKCQAEAARGMSVVELVPFRPQRAWFAPLTRGCELVALAPFAFVGHKSAFPAPLVLIGRNCEIPSLGGRETGRWRSA